MKRKHVPLKTKLASALLALGHIPYEESKGMTADQIVRRYDWDHWPILHALGGQDVPWNLRPLLKAAHREKSRRDTSAVAKVKRLAAVGVKSITPEMKRADISGIFDGVPVRRPKRKIAQRPSPWPPRGTRKLRSRPWPSPSP